MPELDVSIPADDVHLAGTFTTPTGDGPHPAALILAGSGPLDRDGNHSRLPLNVSRDLAGVLEAEGWASLRFDKRGIGESEGEYMPAGFYDELQDARCALRWLVDRSDTSTIVVIGHSIGATYAAEMSAYDPGIAGVVLLAITAKTGRDTLVWQAGAISDTLPSIVTGGLRLFGSSVEKQQAKAIRRLERTDDDVARIQGQKINAKWMREFIAYDPGPTLEVMRTPVLAITGTKDVQVDAQDLEVIAAFGGSGTEVHIVQDLDHILRIEEQPVSNPRKYKRQLEGPIDGQVTRVIVDWLAGLEASTE